VGGLPWLNPAEFRRVKPEGPKKRKTKSSMNRAHIIYNSSNEVRNIH
jgi:hypothetical protein